MPTTRRDFFIGVGPAVVAGAFGFPALAGGKAGEVLSPSTPPPPARTDVLPVSKPPPVPTGSGVASNGYLWSLLPPGRQHELRELNVEPRYLRRDLRADVVHDVLNGRAIAALQSNKEVALVGLGEAGIPELKAGAARIGLDLGCGLQNHLDLPQ